MATIEKNIYDSALGVTASIITSFDNETVTGDTFKLTPSSVKVKVTGAETYLCNRFYYWTFEGNGALVSVNGAYKGHMDLGIVDDPSYVGYNVYKNLSIRSSVTIQTTSIFNSTNYNTRSIPYAIKLGYWSTPGESGYLGYNILKDSVLYYGGATTVNPAVDIYSGELTLDAPPTFSSTQVYFDTDKIYPNYTTAKVDVSSLSAKYGGRVESVILTIGEQQSESRNTNGTLSIPLNTSGTFTPTVTVTDSRGQVTTKTLNPIVVNPYVAPEIAFTLERTNASGTKDDEGTYAVATASFNWTDAIATLSQPTVSAIDSDGTPLSVSATWYTDRVLTTAVDWSSTSSWSSPKTLYGRIGTLPVNESSQVTITPNDSEGSGTAQTQTLASAFYTIDFLAGGHGIAFGQPASEEGFFCNMDSHFSDKAHVMRALFDFVYPVGSYYETSDTTFDPNVTWGGTWALETEGQVHIGAGSTYSVGDTGGSKTVRLSAAIGAATGAPATLNYIAEPVNGWQSAVGRGSYTIQGASWTSNQGWSHSTPVTELNSASRDTNIMQPYIVVNRWHRTA